MPFLILLALLALPAVEIALFIVVGDAIGVLPTLGLVFLAMVVGSVLMRRQGFGTLMTIRREMDAGHVPAEQLGHAALITLAGVLLIIPGFATDIVGLALFIPAVRRFVLAGLARHVEVRVATSGFRTARPGVVDLDPEEFSESASPRPGNGANPWKHLDGPGTAS